MADRTVVVNRKAKHDYHILDVYEAGIVLNGMEVKSLKAGRVSIKEAYVIVDSCMEAYLKGCHISPYPYASTVAMDPLRDKKLLLHKSEIKKLYGMIKEKGLTLIPLKVYIKNGMVKVQIALAKGKKAYDKRYSIKKKIQERDLKAVFKGKVSI